MSTRVRDLFIDFVLRFKKLSICFSLFITCLSLPFLFPQNLDFGPKGWFGAEDDNIEVLERFERTFGNDESILIVLSLKELSSKENVFYPEFFELLDELTDQMWTVPWVLRSESVINYYWSEARGEEIVTDQFVDLDQIHDPEYLDDLSRRVLSHKVVPNIYISRNLNSAIIYGHLASRPNEDPNVREIVSSVEGLIDQYSKDHPNLKFQIMGQPFLSDRFQRVSFLDIGRTTPILLLLMIFYLWWSYRSINGVFIPMTVIFSSLIGTVGLNGYLGLTVNSLTFVLPSILMAISVADSIHILSSFYHYYNTHFDWDKALKQSLEKNIWPIFFTSISTSLGFFSLTVSSIEPVANLGLMAGVGTLLAMTHSFLLVIPLLSFIGTEKRKALVNVKFQERMLPVQKVERFVDWIDRHTKKIILLFVLLSCSALYLGLTNEVNSNPFEYFNSKDPVTKGNEHILENYGGAGGPEFIIDSLEAEGIKTPEFLKRVDELKIWLESKEGINHAIVIIDFIKEMNQALHEGDESEYRIHENREVIAQEIFLYSMSLPQGMGINNRVDGENRRIRMSVFWSLQDSRESLEMIEKIELYAQKLDLNLTTTGKAILFQRMNDYVVLTFFSSMGIALCLITVMMMIVFKSFWIGLLSLVPSFIPVVFGAAVLHLLKTPIDIGSAIVASVTLGIAVDDTIHFLSHYSRLYKRSNSLEKVKKSLVEIISTTGLALFMTTIILVSCFGLFIFAELRPNMIFGVLSAFVISLALICDLLVLPALILASVKYAGGKLNCFKILNVFSRR